MTTTNNDTDNDGNDDDDADDNDMDNNSRLFVHFFHVKWNKQRRLKVEIIGRKKRKPFGQGWNKENETIVGVDERKDMHPNEGN